MTAAVTDVVTDVVMAAVKTGIMTAVIGGRLNRCASGRPLCPLGGDEKGERRIVGADF